MSRLVILVCLFGCAKPQYLGESLPRECGASFARCDGALHLRMWEDSTVATEPELTRYVARVTARIVAVSSLSYVPRVVVIPDGNAAVLGHTVVVGREMVVKLGSESELAAIIAHEVVHLESEATESYDLANDADQRDAEAVADERAVLLLERADYPGSAMSVALRRTLSTVVWESTHPPTKERILRTSIAAMSSPARDDRRSELLAAISGVIVGPELERGLRVRDHWVVADRDASIGVPTGVSIDRADAQLLGHAGDVEYNALRVGRRAAAEVRQHLTRTRHRMLPIGAATIGDYAGSGDRSSSRSRLVEQYRAALAHADAGDSLAIIERPNGAILLVVRGPGSAEALERWLPLVRVPTAAERSEAISPRVRLLAAPRTASVEELVLGCIDPAQARALDDPTRVIHAGELFKCTDRVSHSREL